MPGFVVSPAAERDIAELWSRIAADNENAARRITVEIYAAFGLLGDMPGLGHT